MYILPYNHAPEELLYIIMKIEIGFYNIPIVVAFMVAILVACFQNKKTSFDDKLGVMAKGVACLVGGCCI